MHGGSQRTDDKLHELETLTTVFRLKLLFTSLRLFLLTANIDPATLIMVPLLSLAILLSRLVTPRGGPSLSAPWMLLLAKLVRVDAPNDMGPDCIVPLLEERVFSVRNVVIVPLLTTAGSLFTLVSVLRRAGERSSPLSFIGFRFAWTGEGSICVRTFSAVSC